jgi:luciferase family oxidoreductase group 1
MLTSLSAIEIQSPLMVPILVQHLETLGYLRFWTTEHHAPGQSGSPTVIAAVAAAVTTRIRIGTAGIMVRYQSPMRIAEDFHLLEALFPARIDLGLISNSAPTTEVDLALLENRTYTHSFGHRAAMIASFLRSEKDSNAPNKVATLQGERTPSLWICGLSANSGRLAGQLGAGFAYSAYQGQFSTGGVSGDAFEAYRRYFQPAGDKSSPTPVLSCYGVCGESERKARRTWDWAMKGAAREAKRTGRSITLSAVPDFLGTPDRCHEELQALSDRFEVSEIMVQCFGRTLDEKIDGYSLLAESFSLERVQADT